MKNERMRIEFVGVVDQDGRQSSSGTPFRTTGLVLTAK